MDCPIECEQGNCQYYNGDLYCLKCSIAENYIFIPIS